MWRPDSEPGVLGVSTAIFAMHWDALPCCRRMLPHIKLIVEVEVTTTRKPKVHPKFTSHRF